ncbi:undecaprenyl-diphosphatase [Microlunatus sagamiharensis]|uniref:Undecaprenyl-diphosphatase n=1 Tax=Microlunatus sagamiharensis TaxID=546874 RepID=A0A1H2M653_9ACTN|nr:phosphatase PAP2 family protein [Microlunatus sagamiharensis]SDU88495.1 undecaprenyl-diphosphatase [Microlunatus sagamiharensis]
MQGSERPTQPRGVERRGSTALEGRPVVTHWYGPVGTRLAHVATGVGHRVGAQPALAIVLLVGGIIAFTASFLVSRVYDAVVENDGVAMLDRPMLQEAMQLRRPWLDEFSAGVAYVFGPVGMPLIAVAAILLLALTRRSWTPVILVAGAGVGSLLMTIAGKDIIGRSRPPLVDAVPPFEHSPSFPSGHSLNATVVAGVVGYLLWLHRHAVLAKIACVVVPVVLAVVVGLTRVLLGAHWFTDVLAAWLLGAGWLAVVVTAHRLYLTARERGAPEAPQPRASTQSHGSHRT